MCAEGSSYGGPLGNKRTSLFGHLNSMIETPTRKSSGLNTSGAKSELGFVLGNSRPSYKGGMKTMPRNSMVSGTQPQASPNKGSNPFDKSSMMSRFSYMSANTVFLQYRSNQLYFAAM